MRLSVSPSRSARTKSGLCARATSPTESHSGCVGAPRGTRVGSTAQSAVQFGLGETKIEYAIAAVAEAGEVHACCIDGVPRAHVADGASYVVGVAMPDVAGAR